MDEIIQLSLLLITSLTIGKYCVQITRFSVWFYSRIGLDASDFLGNSGYLKFFSRLISLLACILLGLRLLDSIKF